MNGLLTLFYNSVIIFSRILIISFNIINYWLCNGLSFDDLYINMVAAGEASGSLPEILRRLAAGLTVIQELQGKVTQAMIYPALLIVACICLLIVFMTVLIPQLTSLLADSGTKLPLATELLMKFSAFFGKWWWLMGTVCVAGFLLFRGYINTPAGRMWWAM